MADVGEVGVLEKPEAEKDTEHPGGGVRYGSLRQYLRMLTCAIYFNGGIIWYGHVPCTRETQVIITVEM